jgi:hypothetical protein
MLFSKIFAGVAMAATALAAITPAQLAANINTLTDKSRALQAPAESINYVNGVLIVTGGGPFPAIITGFRDIVTTASVTVSQLQGFKPVKGANSDIVFEAFLEVSGLSFSLKYLL